MILNTFACRHRLEGTHKGMMFWKTGGMGPVSLPFKKWVLSSLYQLLKSPKGT